MTAPTPTPHASRGSKPRPASGASHSPRFAFLPPSLTSFASFPLFEYSYRCGEQGRGLKKCPQPAKYFHCGQPNHVLKDCPKAPPRPAKAPAAPAPAKVAA
ncbi:hypothetical protein C8R44DRAFT_945004 [Mycena epipterygia]|nr:hypothetical protein C8R44DRAFT_945004 [Mycena epipterygia]